MYKTTIDKIIEIYKRSGLSISKFASIIQKDRRTLTSWIDKITTKEPSNEVKHSISKFFRYPYKIWDEECHGDEFLSLLEGIPQEEIRIIDEGYYGGLIYILECENLERFVIHPQFPGPMYRDTTVPRVYRSQSSTEIETLKQQRTQKMLEYNFTSTEWYSIKALLSFCFSDIGNFYTKEQKLQILDLYYDTFHDNYNKSLYFFDSFSRKIYGLDTAYTSINIKKNIMFFKAPLESVFIEIKNKKLIDRIYRHFTSPSEAPNHINRNESTKIIKILRSAIELDKNLIETYEDLNTLTDYGKLFYNNLSLSIQKQVSLPKEGQKRS